MKEYNFDLWRILMGDQPPLFLLEVAFRTIVIFSYTLLLLRWMGKRGMGQLTPFEFAIIVALGSAVGDPMFYDDVPLIHTMLVIGIVIGLQHFLSWITESNKTIESWIEGEAVCLIEHGVINKALLQSERLSQTELFDALRTQGIVQLGQIRAAYLERSGRVSVLRASPVQPGLCVLPDTEVIKHNDDMHVLIDQLCCGQCGKLLEPLSARRPCSHCGQTQPVAAVSS